MTVKVTGYQWMWKYEYLGEDVSFTSRLDRKHDELRQSGKVADRGRRPALPARTSTTCWCCRSTPRSASCSPPTTSSTPGGCRRWAGSRTRSRASSTRPGPDREARHLPRPVRRAVRQGPRLHADRGQGRDARPSSRSGWPKRRPGAPRPCPLRPRSGSRPRGGSRSRARGHRRRPANRPARRRAGRLIHASHPEGLPMSATHPDAVDQHDAPRPSQAGLHRALVLLDQPQGHRHAVPGVLAS